MNSTAILKLLENRHSDDVFVPECKDGPTQTGSHLRLDAWAMSKSWANPCMTGYEIKVSRGDFLKDNKWPGYLPLCNLLFFACPAGLIQPDEVPENVGLVWASKTGGKLYTKKKAAYREVQAPEDLFRYVLMCRARITREYVATNNREFWSAWLEDRKIDREFGYKLSTAIRERIETEITTVRMENERLRAQAGEYDDIRKLLASLGINPDSKYEANKYTVERKLNEVRKVLPKNLLYELGQLAETATRLKAKLEEIEAPDTDKAFAA